MNISIEKKSTQQLLYDLLKDILLLFLVEFSFPEEYGTVIQMQCCVFFISTTTGNMPPLISHHWLHFCEKTTGLQFS